MSDAKLYVVVRKDLSKSQQAVQAGHALAEYLLKRPDTQWDNGTLVYLAVKDEKVLKDLTDQLEYDNIDSIKFTEPDINDELTAIASLGTNRYFKQLRLI